MSDADMLGRLYGTRCRRQIDQLAHNVHSIHNMPPRRGAPSNNTLSPPDTGAPSQAQGQTPGFLNFPRSASPSGFTGFLSKPTKWFNRSASGGSIAGRSSTSSTEPRSSTSSAGRKPKISHPTDPRPILDSLRPEPTYGSQGASRYVSASTDDIQFRSFSQVGS